MSLPFSPMSGTNPPRKENMSYKIIHDRFWTDPYVRKLRPNEKLLFLYFITNPHAHYSGIYYISIPEIVMETGLSEKEVKKGINTLSEGYQKGMEKVSGGYLIQYDAENSLIWVRNMLKYQATGQKQIIGVANHLKTLHKSNIIKEFLDYYAYLQIPYQYPTDRVSEGYRGGIPQESEYRNQNSEIRIQESESLKETLDINNKNNNIYNNYYSSSNADASDDDAKNISKKFFSPDSKEYQLAQYLLETIIEKENSVRYKALSPSQKEQKIQSWARHIDLLLRVDKRPEDEIQSVIDWATGDQFWRTNILSADKLRKQYDKLIGQMTRSPQYRQKKTDDIFNRLIEEEMRDAN